MPKVTFSKQSALSIAEELQLRAAINRLRRVRLRDLVRARGRRRPFRLLLVVRLGKLAHAAHDQRP